MSRMGASCREKERDREACGDRPAVSAQRSYQAARRGGTPGPTRPQGVGPVRTAVGAAATHPVDRMAGPTYAQSMSFEVEVKYRSVDHDELRRRLIERGA